jgi:DNA-binding transcriptional LysR family regulator
VFKNLNDIRLFAEVVRHGAVTRGAVALGLPAATVSRRLAALEHDVGLRLIERHARRFELTEAGRAYDAAARRALEEIDQAAAEVSSLPSRPAGHLRVAAPPDFATFFMARALANFAAQYPDVTVSLDVASRRVSLVDEGFDVAVRVGALADSRLVSRRLMTLTRSLYASPAYLAQAPRVLRPSDLAQCRLVTLNADATVGEVVLQRKGRAAQTRSLSVHGHINVNSMPMLRQLLLMGAGVGLVPDRLVEEELHDARLQRVLPAWQAPPVDAHVVYRSRTLLPKRVRLFVEHLVASLA